MSIVRWNRILSSDIAVSPVVTDQTVYVVTTDNKVLAFDPRLGKDKWKNPPTIE